MKTLQAIGIGFHRAVRVRAITDFYSATGAGAAFENRDQGTQLQIQLLPRIKRPGRTELREAFGLQVKFLMMARGRAIGRGVGVGNETAIDGVGRRVLDLEADRLVRHARILGADRAGEQDKRANRGKDLFHGPSIKPGANGAKEFSTLGGEGRYTARRGIFHMQRFARVKMMIGRVRRLRRFREPRDDQL